MWIAPTELANNIAVLLAVFPAGILTLCVIIAADDELRKQKSRK